MITYLGEEAPIHQRFRSEILMAVVHTGGTILLGKFKRLVDLTFFD